MLCVLILYINGGIYSLKSTSERQIFLSKLLNWHLITLRVFARNLLRWNRRRNIFRILFWCLAWGPNPGFSSNKPKHYLLDHGDLIFDHTSYIISIFFFWSSTQPSEQMRLCSCSSIFSSSQRVVSYFRI